MPIHNCEAHTSCDTCVSAGGPYCGWCTLQDKCTDQKGCRSLSRGDENAWIRYEEKCIAIKEVTPQMVSMHYTEPVGNSFGLTVGFFCLSGRTKCLYVNFTVKLFPFLSLQYGQIAQFYSSIQSDVGGWINFISIAKSSVPKYMFPQRWSYHAFVTKGVGD